jgi:hypothetical protein
MAENRWLANKVQELFLKALRRTVLFIRDGSYWGVASLISGDTATSEADAGQIQVGIHRVNC